MCFTSRARLDTSRVRSFTKPVKEPQHDKDTCLYTNKKRSLGFEPEVVRLQDRRSNHSPILARWKKIQI